MNFLKVMLLKNLVVSSFNGNNVYLKDIAEVRDTIRESKLDTKINGAKGMSMYVQKQSGGNTVKVTKEVEKSLATLKKDLPPDVKIEKLFDSASFIKGLDQQPDRDINVCCNICNSGCTVLPGKMESYFYYYTYNSDLTYCCIHISVCYRCLNKYYFTYIPINCDRDGGG